MQQRRPRLGDVLDDYCPRERRVTNHVVVAMIEDDIKQTRCSTCDAEHEYKQARVPSPRRPKTVAAIQEGAESFESILVPLVNRSESNIKPATWDDILRDMNAPPNETAFMGVNGIDNDPHAHPYARTDLLGGSCTSNAGCGGEGNLCLRSGSASARVCGSVCIDDAGCPADFRCAAIASGGQLAPKRACVAR